MDLIKDKKLIAISGLSLATLSLIFVFQIGGVYSATITGQSSFKCEKKGSSTTCLVGVTLPENTAYQAWKGIVSGHVNGHGGAGPAGGKYGIEGCLSPTFQWWADGSSCDIIVDPNTGGNIGDNEVDVNQSRDIGNDINPDYNYWLTKIYVNDATFDPLRLEVQGRRVNVDYFAVNSLEYLSQTVNSGDSFPVSWRVSDALPVDKIRFSWSGPITCDKIGPVTKEDSSGCTASGSGEATVTITADGPGGNGPTTESKTITITVVGEEIPPPGAPGAFSIYGSSCFGWPSSAIEVNINTSSGASTYDLERSVNGGGWGVHRSGLSYAALDSYSDTSISDGSSYEYRVRAYNSSGSTLSSNTSGSIQVNAANCGVTPTPTPIRPTCASATPDGDTVYSNSTRRVFANGVANATSVYFPTWSDPGGQNDLIWYSGTNAGSGTWYADINMNNHGTGTMNTHVYMNNANYANEWCDSANFTSVPPLDVSLTAFPTSVSAGGNVTVTWSNVASPKTTDWVGLYTPGSPESSWVNDTWFYTSSCAKTPGGTALGSGSCSFTMPLIVDTYEFRLFRN